MEEERKTQLANEILTNMLINYKEQQLRIFLATLNKATTKYYAIDRDSENYNQYGEYIEVEIPLSFYKKYGGKGKYTKESWEEIVKGINIPININEDNIKSTINLISRIDFYVEEEKFVITFNEEYFEYVVLLRDSNYTIIDLEELNQLSGKYEIGVYLAYWQFVEQGKRMFTIENCKMFFSFKGEKTKELTRALKKAIDSINLKLGYDIELETKISNRKITHINFLFRRGKKKTVSSIIRNNVGLSLQGY
jgi:hypothetical protein